MGTDEAIHVNIKQAKEAQRIKEDMIARGACEDDLGCGAWLGIYEQSSRGHPDPMRAR